MTEKTKVNRPLSKKSVCATLFLIALYYALLATRERLNTYWDIDEIIMPFMILFGMQLALYSLLRRIVSADQAALMLTVITTIIVMQFSYFLDYAEPAVALAAWVAVLVSGWVMAIKIPKLRDIIFPMLVTYIVIFTVGNLISFAYILGWQSYSDDPAQKKPLWRDAAVKTDKAPDIFFILQDAYASTETLRRLFDVDNTGFINFLRDEGFYVAEESKSHYSQTMLSVASTLNMNFIQDDIVLPDDEFADRGPAAHNFLRPRLIDFLLAQGYEIDMSSTGYDLDIDPKADESDIRAENFRLSALSVLLDRTPFYPALDIALGRDRTFLNPHLDHYQNIIDQYEGLSSAARQRSDRPRFIYAHILLPHPPFVFDAQGGFSFTGNNDLFSYKDGKGVRHDHLYEEGWQDFYQHGYAAQIQAANVYLKKFVETATSIKSDRPLVIIIQGDHGSRLRANFYDLNDSDKDEIFGILNAVYFSDRGYKGFTPDISPLNAMRLMINHHFATDMPLVKNYSWFSTWQKPYKFIEVKNLRQH